jgi:hypothetical protein
MVIVSHGDHGGVLMFDPPLRANASTVRNDLIRLRSFLKPDAMIICIGCISGLGEAGAVTALPHLERLIAVSPPGLSYR